MTRLAPGTGDLTLGGLVDAPSRRCDTAKLLLTRRGE